MENAKFCEYCGAKFTESEAPEHLPKPEEKRRLFVVDDVFKITGRGNVLVGTVVNSRIFVGETLSLADSAGNPVQDVTIIGMQMFSRKDPTSAEAGEHVGLLVDFEVQAKRGMMLLK